MSEPRIEDTEEFDFIKKFVDRSGRIRSSPKDGETADILYSVGPGAGLCNQKRAIIFVREVCVDIRNVHKDKMRVFPLNLSDKIEFEWKSPLRRSVKNKPEFWRLVRTYLGFNPNVAAAYVDFKKGYEKAFLNVLMREDLTEREIQQLVSKAEKWRDFFLRVDKEFDSNDTYFGYREDSNLVLAVEDVALKADPTLERDYKDTGTVRLEPIDVESFGLNKKWNVDGFPVALTPTFGGGRLIVDSVRRVPEVAEVELENITDNKSKKDLIGKRVDFHVNGYTIGNDYVIRHSGTLLRVLD